MAQTYPPPCDEGAIRAQPCPRALGVEPSVTRKRFVLIACILASSMAFIDGSALTVALPALRADFGAGYASVQWVLNGYVLALASLTLIGGALADVYGKARMLMIGAAAFGLTSAACALAPSVDWLVAARIAQGASAAIVTPASLALIGATYPREERGGAIGVWAAASALTTAGGPILGGWLTETFSWQAVFWINPPVAAATVLVLLLFSQTTPKLDRGFDWIGAGLIAAALAGFAFALSSIGPTEGVGDADVQFGPRGWSTLAGALALLGAYAFWETRTREPLTPPRLLANRPFVALNLATLFIYGGMSVMFFALPFELIDRRGLTPIETGFTFLPFTIGVGLLSQVFGGLADRIGARFLLIAGPLGAAAAFLLMSALREQSVWLGVILPMAVLGLAFAVMVAPLTASVMNAVDDSDEGLASGINNAASRAAQLIGVALAAGLAQFALGFHFSMAVAAAASVAGALFMFSLPRAAGAPAADGAAGH